MTTTLVLGGTGATGRLLIPALLERGIRVRAIVRSAQRLPRSVLADERVDIVEASLLDLSDDELARHVNDCNAVASCLGHTLSFKGIFGQPRRLVTDATRRICSAIDAQESDSRVKFVLMNTTGNRNRGLDERISLAQRIVIWMIRVLLPPHADNEDAAEHLRTRIGPDHRRIEWVAVRPDALKDHDEVTPYDVHPSPIRSAIFNPGQTSRINVAAFMSTLIADDDVWTRWRGQMPVIYNSSP